MEDGEDRKRKELIDLYFEKFSKRKKKYYEPDSNEGIPPTPKKVVTKAAQAGAVPSRSSSGPSSQRSGAVPSCSSSGQSSQQSESFVHSAGAFSSSQRNAAESDVGTPERQAVAADILVSPGSSPGSPSTSPTSSHLTPVQTISYSNMGISTQSATITTARDDERPELRTVATSTPNRSSSSESSWPIQSCDDHSSSDCDYNSSRLDVLSQSVGARSSPQPNAPERQAVGAHKLVSSGSSPSSSSSSSSSSSPSSVQSSSHLSSCDLFSDDGQETSGMRSNVSLNSSGDHDSNAVHDNEMPQNNEQQNHNEGNDQINPLQPQQIDQQQNNRNEGNNQITINYNQLHRKIADDHFFDNITCGVAVSPADLLYMALGLAKQNKFTNKALFDSIKLLNCTFNSSVLPKSIDLLDKLIMDKTGVQYYFYCRECTKSFGLLDFKNIKEKVCDDENCRAVNKISDLRVAHYFAMFDVVRGLESLLGQPEVRNALLKPADAVANGQHGFLSDIYCGSMYKEFAERFSKCLERIISFLFCTDGAPLFQSSLNSIWPIMLAVNELPVKVRMKNIVLCGLWFGKRQPPMELLLEPVVNYFIGFSEGFHIHLGNEDWLVKAFIIGCVVDSGARGVVQGVKSHGGYDACNWCIIHGLYLNHNVRYPLGEECPRKRDHERLVQLQRELANQNDGEGEESPRLSDDETPEDNHNAVEGVISVSPLINLPQFDMVNSFFVEPMHLHLGVTKTFLLKWLGDVGEDWYIKGHMQQINERINLLRPPLEFRRMPRTLEERLRWKAREFENWLLFLVAVVLKGILPDKYVKLWLLFAQAVYLLSQRIISSDHINTADALLKRFLALSKEYYGEVCMVFNMHLLYHLAEHCARWGPLRSASAYCFENYNGFLKKIIRSQQGIPNQVLRALSWEQSLKTLEPRVSAKARDYVKSLPSKKPRGFEVCGCLLVGEAQLFVPNENERWLAESLGCNIESCEVYNKILRNGCIFSKFSAASRTNNSVAQYNDGTIVVIHKIIYERDQEQVFVYVSSVLTETVLAVPPRIQLNENDHLMRKVTHVEDEIQCIPVENLKIVCFRASLDHGDYVAPLPNVHNVF